MTLPVTVKTWQYNVNQRISAQGTYAANSQKMMRTIVNSLIGFANHAWTTCYSCNGTTAGTAGDTVNRWTSDGYLVWNNAGSAHSWWVGKQTGISSNFQVCIDLNSSFSYNATIVISNSAGFTGGSTTARPTATDEIVLLTTSVWGSNTTDKDQIVHVLQSTDGYCTRVLLYDTSVCKGYWMFDTPINTVSGWTNPNICTILGSSSSTGVVTLSNLYTTANCHGYGVSAMTLFLTCEGGGGSPLTSLVNSANDLGGSFPMFPIGIASTTASNRGRHGSMIDLWYGSSAIADGDSYPGNNSCQFLQNGLLIQPWNGSSPVLV